MKIYFCDKCNESIPLSDMQTNRITIDQGKIYCAQCAPKPVRTKASVGGWPLAIGMLVCFAGGMTAMAFFGDKLLRWGTQRESLDQRVARLESRSDERLGTLERRLDGIDQDLDETKSGGKLERLRGTIGENAEGIRRLQVGFNRVQDSVKSEMEAQRQSSFEQGEKLAAKTRNDIDAQRELHERDVQATRAEIRLLTDTVEILEGRLRSVEEGASKVLSSPSADATSEVTKPTDTVDPVTKEAVAQARRMLKSKNSTERFEAVFNLGEIKGRLAEEALVEALDDSVDYIRTTAINNLVTRSARWTTPNIIGKLSDKNVFVREAAIAAIEGLTGRKLDLDPEASPSKINSKVRELERWWRDNGAKLISG